VGLFITALSLFVGGIGIMNIMFVSVTERTKGNRNPEGSRCEEKNYTGTIPDRIFSDLSRRRTDRSGSFISVEHAC